MQADPAAVVTSMQKISPAVYSSVAAGVALWTGCILAVLPAALRAESVCAATKSVFAPVWPNVATADAASAERLTSLTWSTTSFLPGGTVSRLVVATAF